MGVSPFPQALQMNEMEGDPLKQFIDRVDARLDAWGEALKRREFRFPSDLTAGIVFALVGIFMLLAMPSQITVTGGDVVDGRAFPALLMIVMLAGCAALIGKELVKLARKQPITWKTVNLLVEVKALVILGILLVTYLLCKYTGLFVLGAVFCALGFLVFFRCRKRSYYVITLGLAAGIWCAFRFGLGVSF